MQTNLTEQRLCRIWKAGETSGDWWTVNETLYDIAMVLRDQGSRADVIDAFVFTSTLALSRAVYAVKERPDYNEQCKSISELSKKRVQADLSRARTVKVSA